MYDTFEDRPRLRFSPRVIAGAAVVLLAAAGAIVWAQLDDHPAETAVKDFFEALGEGDADAALALVSSRAGGELLTDEVIDMPWGTPETEVEETASRSAAVTAGVETGEGSEQVEYEVELVDDEWLLVEPFIWVTFTWQAVDYGQANDSITTFEYPVVEGFPNPGQTLALFPGEYEFYQSVPEVIAIESDGPRTLLEPNGSENAIEVGAPVGAAFEPEAVAEVQEAVDAQMAECLESQEPMLDNCPFGIYEDFTNAEGEDLDELGDLEWSATEPITVAVGEYESGTTFPVIPEPAGSPVNVTGTGVNRDDDFTVESFTASCPLDFSAWLVTLVSDGERIGLDLNVIEMIHREDDLGCLAE